MIEEDLADIERWIIVINGKLDKLIEHLMPKPKAENKELKSTEKKGQTVEEKEPNKTIFIKKDIFSLIKLAKEQKKSEETLKLKAEKKGQNIEKCPRCNSEMVRIDKDGIDKHLICSKCDAEYEG